MFETIRWGERAPPFRRRQVTPLAALALAAHRDVVLDGQAGQRVRFEHLCDRSRVKDASRGGRERQVKAGA